MVSAADNDWTEVVRNLEKSSAVWQRLTRILNREGTAPWVYGLFFKAVVQSVLLLGAETWVVTPPHGTDTGGVPGPGGATIDKRLLRIRTDGKWEYTSAAVAREEAEFGATEE